MSNYSFLIFINYLHALIVSQFSSLGLEGFGNTVVLAVKGNVGP